MLTHIRQWLLARWWIIIAITVAGIVGAVVISQNLQPEPVLAYQLSYENVTATTTVTGEVKARTTVAVSPPVNAQIASVTVDDGDMVQAGQTLVTLDAQDTTANLDEARARLAEAEAAFRFIRQGTRQEEVARYQASVLEAQSAVRQSQAAYAAAQSRLENAKNKAGRMTQLYQEEVLSKQEYEQAITERDVASQEAARLQADIQAASFRQKQTQEQLRLAKNGPTKAELDQANAARNSALNAVKAVGERASDRVIKSTIDGIVLKRLQDPGEMAVTGQAILRLADWKTIEIEGLVEEADLLRVKLGDLAYVILDADPEKPISAKITRIGSEVNPDNGTVEVTVKLLPKPGEAIRLLPGMTADINIITQRLNHTLVIPASAVNKEGGQTLVYVFEGNRVKQRKVNLKRVSLQYFQVVSGLNPGDTIARFASVKLLEKRRIEPSTTTLDAMTKPAR